MYKRQTLDSPGLSKNHSLGKFSPDEKGKLRFSLSIPSEWDNSYALRDAEVQWIFTVNENSEKKTGSGKSEASGHKKAQKVSSVKTGDVYKRQVVCSGDALILEQITKQLAKLVDVRDIKVLEPDNSVSRELVLVKVTAKPEQREGIISIANIFRANVIDVGKDSLVIELTGSKSKLGAFVDLLEDYEILELARTGITGLSRGAADVRFF